MPDPSDASQQSCSSCGAAVDTSNAEPLARVACPACGEKFRVQRAFDNFEVVEILGVGGMGSVYKARDTRLDRFVALKVLRSELSADPAEAARLEQEARVTASVNHPNVVQVYSTGTAHGQIYIVIELVNHGSLDDLIAQHARVPEAQVLEAGIQVARGLQAAHQKGLVHRDVKPANILFSDAHTAKIGDFGLAVAAGQQAEAPNEIWGTPYYVAPERLNNEPEDFRSDIYSLGATLFHAFAGKPPMEGETTSASALRQLKSIPPDLGRVAPDLSRETVRIVNRMLAPNPAHRFATYEHLLDQLQRAYRALPRNGQHEAARRGLQWWQIAAAVLLVGGLAAGGAYFWKNGAAAPEAAGTSESSASTPAAPAVAAVNPALQRRYEEARAQLIAGKIDAATSALTRLASEAKGQQPLLNWIQLHRGLAALLQGKTSPAREAFQEVERAANFSTAKEDAALVGFFNDTARPLAAAGPVRASVTTDLDPKGVQAFALFLFAIKNWQLNEFAEAAPLLERFVVAEPGVDLAWINDYKPVAQKLLADYPVYLEWKKTPPRFANVVELRNGIAKLRELEGQLKTKSALKEAIGDHARKLATDLAQREKREKEAKAAENKQLLEEQTPLWEAAVDAARGQIAVYDFNAALKTIDDAAVTAPALEERRSAEKKRITRLVEWKTQLIGDLRKTGVAGTITDLLGTTYSGAAGATDDRIVLRTPYGTTEVEWTKLAPATLLSLANSFIRGTPQENAERQWRSAIFAHSTKQEEAARQLADAAVKANPALGDERPLLSLPR